MARVTYMQSDGRAESFDVPNGLSVMEGAVRNNVAGIIAECGGSCACGTCKVVVDAAWADRLSERGPLEESMIEDADAAQQHLRLSCQITVSDALDGLVVHVPHTQR